MLKTHRRCRDLLSSPGVGGNDLYAAPKPAIPLRGNAITACTFRTEHQRQADHTAPPEGTLSTLTHCLETRGVSAPAAVVLGGELAVKPAVDLSTDDTSEEEAQSRFAVDLFVLEANGIRDGQAHPLKVSGEPGRLDCSRCRADCI